MRRSSPREPTPTKKATLADCAVGMGVVTMRSPLSSVLISGRIASADGMGACSPRLVAWLPRA